MVTMAIRTFHETRERPVPTIILTDMTVRSLNPVTGKRVTYLDKSIKGFGVRITENGVKTFVLTYGEDRKRVKLGDLGILALKDAREKAKDILAQRQLNSADNTPSIAYEDGRTTRPRPSDKEAISF
jgi:Arm DNA-binding domain